MLQNYEIPLDEEIGRRIESEKSYHELHYKFADTAQPVNFDLATSARRKPHNLTWAYFDTILDRFQGDIAGKKILVVGCGQGLVALNLVRQGAKVDAFDLSDRAIDICQLRAKLNSLEGANFFVSSCEGLRLSCDHYDAVVGEMILHHIDIPTSVRQFHRWLKAGGVGVFMEWKVYPFLDDIRQFPLLRRLFPPGGVDGYVTEYERKLSKADFQEIRRFFPDMRLDYRYCMRGKIDYFSSRFGNMIEKFDYRLLRMFPVLNSCTDGVVISFTKNAEQTGE